MARDEGIGHESSPAGSALDPASLAFARSGLRFPHLGNDVSFGQLPSCPHESLRAMRESNPRPTFWRRLLCHLTNLAWPAKAILTTRQNIRNKGVVGLVIKREYPFIVPSFSSLSKTYFLLSLKATCFRSLALYFLSSIFFSTFFLFLRDQ